MSFLVKSPQLPASQAPNQQMQSGYQDPQPVPLGWGTNVYPASWLSDVYSKLSVAQKNQPDYQFASIAAAYCQGPIDYVGQLFKDGDGVHFYDYTFAPGEDSHQFTIPVDLPGGHVWSFTVYRGSETQAASSTLRSGTGQNHPPYRGLCWVEWTNVPLGTGGASMPSLSLELGRKPAAIGSYTPGLHRFYGTNPFAAIYALLQSTRGGLGAAASLLDDSHWAAQCAALEATGIGQRTGQLTWTNPLWTNDQDAGSALADVLAYVDGFLYFDGTLKVGWFPNNIPATAGLPQIVEGDLDDKPGGDGFNDWSAGKSSVVVVYKDPDRVYNDEPAAYQAPANRTTGALVSRPTRQDRPFCHAGDQAAIMAAELAADPSHTTDSGVSLSVLKSRAVDGTGAPLLPGALLEWNYAPLALDVVCRVTERRIRLGAASDTLAVVRERGAFPRPYVPPVDPRVLPTPDAPGAIDPADVRLWLLPSGLATARELAPLVNRTKNTIYRADLWLSADGSTDWADILDSRFFAARGAQSGAISGSAATVRVVSGSVDFTRMVAQSATMQADDTLLLLVDDEVMSVGAISAVATDTCDLAVLRGRQGTAAVAHADGAVAWLFYRGELASVAHAEFSAVRNGSGVYDAALATKHFKIQLFTLDDAGDPKPDDPGLALQFPDLAADPTAAYSVVLTSDAHTVACAADGTPLAGELGASGLAKTTVVVYRGFDLLTAVASAPDLNQFSVSLGALVNATATKETSNTIRADTVTAPTATIELTIEVAGAFTVTKVFALTKAVAGPAGPQGTTGTPGMAGSDGQTSYFHVAYASSADGASGFNQTSGAYIGTYVDFTAADSADYHAYTWRQFVGAQGAQGDQGIPGTNGANGQTSYLHIKYSDDGGTTFTASGGEAVGAYIGTYVDFTATDSGSVGAYTWARLKGDQGIQGIQGPQGTTGTPGTNGADGQTSYFHVAYASSADGASGFNQTAGAYIGTYVDFTATDSADYHAYTWRQFVGAQGAQGNQGVPGTNGANGQTSYLHIKYSDDGGTTFTASGGEAVGAYIGTYVDFTATDSSSVGAYTWARLKGDQGIQGPQGTAGTNGTDGTDGHTIERRYLRSALVPGTPAGDSPAGWTVAIPSGTDALWVSEVLKDSAGHALAAWSTPQRLTGNIVFYSSGLPSAATHTLLDGDTAIDLSDNNKLYRYASGAWAAAFQPLLALDGSNNVSGLVKADGTSRDFVLACDKFQIWNGTSADVPFELVSGQTFIKEAVIQSVSAGKIAAGNMTGVNIGRSGRLFNPSYSSHYFKSVELATGTNTSHDWGSGTGFTFTHDTGVRFYGPASGSAPIMNPQDDGTLTILYFGVIFSYAGLLTIYYRKNGTGSYLPMAAYGSTVEADFRVSGRRQLSGLAATDYLDFYIAPCDGNGDLSADNLTKHWDLDIMAFNW